MHKIISINERDNILKHMINQTNIGSFDQAIRMILLGADPNTQDQEGNTILFTATILGDSAAIIQLLQYGCNANIMNNYGRCAISYTRRFDIIKIFLENGVNATHLNKFPNKIVNSALLGGASGEISDNNLINILNLYIKHGLDLTDTDWDGLTLVDIIKFNKLEETPFGKFIIDETDKKILNINTKRYIDNMNFLRENLSQMGDGYAKCVDKAYTLIVTHKIPISTTDEYDNIIYYYLKDLDDVKRFIKLVGNDIALQWYNDITKKNLVDMAIEYHNDELLRFYLEHNVGHNYQPEVIKILKGEKIVLTESELGILEREIPDLYILLNHVHKYLMQNYFPHKPIMLENYKKYLLINYKKLSENIELPIVLIESFCDNINGCSEMLNNTLIHIIYYIYLYYSVDVSSYDSVAVNVSSKILKLFVPN